MEEQIDKYLQGQLSADERTAFEARCKAEPALAAALGDFVSAEHAARRYARQARFGELNAMYDELAASGKTKVRSMNLRTYMMVAAAAVVALAGVFLGYQQLKPTSPAGLYAAHVTPFPLSFQRGASTEDLNQLSEVYYQKDYEKAIILAENLLADSTVENKNKLYMCLGMSLLFNGQTTEAIAAFHQVDSVSSFIENAQWYTALAYLKAKDLAAAKPIFEQIASSDHYKRQVAVEILENL